MAASLSRDVLIATLAAPAGPWTSVDVFDVVSSTNEVSLARPSAWRLVVADRQDAGRGRHARPWVSPPGTSVAMSMTVPLPPRPERWGWVPLAAGLAVRDALVGLRGDDEGDAPDGPALDVGLKWPNDVLVHRDGTWRKVCGILCEGGEEVVVVGIGVNVAVPQDDLPVATATSLHLEGFTAPDARERVVIAVASAFSSRYAALVEGGAAHESLRADYREACTTLGATARIELPGGGRVTGVGSAVDDDGRLVLDSDGTTQAYAAGDVVHVRPTGRTGLTAPTGPTGEDRA